jgi:uncharacterized protein (TIGR02118 family)
MFCATVIYPWIDGKSFAADSYARDIAPRYAALLGNNCLGYEVRVGRNAPGQPHPPYTCLVSFWLGSAEKFGAALGTPEMAALMADIRAFTDIEPQRQFDEVIANTAGQGGALSDVVRVVSLAFKKAPSPGAPRRPLPQRER